MVLRPSFQNLISPRKFISGADMEFVKLTALKMLSEEDFGNRIEEYFDDNEWEKTQVVVRDKLFFHYTRNIEYDDRRRDIYVVSEDNIFKLLSHIVNSFTAFKNIKGLYAIQKQIIQEQLSGICIFTVSENDILAVLEYIEGGK